MFRSTRWVFLAAGLFLLPKESLAQVGKIILDSPVNGAANQVVTPMLTWWTDAVARYYRIQLSPDSTFASTRLDTTIVADTTQQKQSLSLGPLLNDTVYYWRVNGNTVSTGGSPGPWSTIYHFRTIPSQPSPPTLLAPASGSQNLPLVDTLKWNAVAIADAYRIQVSTSSAFTSLVLDSIQSEFAGQQTQTFFLGSLTNAVTYYWRIYSRNAAGQSASPSATWSFSTIMAPPSAPTLIAPAADAISQDTANQTLTWGSTTPVSSTYRIQIATDSLFTSPVVDDSTVSTPSKALSPPLRTNTAYFWRVRGKNTGGSGPYSVVRRFFSILRPPVPVIPASGATNLPLSFALDWSPVPGATLYRVQVALSTSFSPFILNTTTTADSLALSGLLNNTTYYWRVGAIAANGDTSRYPASPWSFKTIPAIPPAPALTTPAQGATSQPVSGLSLTWGVALDAASYHVQVCPDSTFSATLLVNDSTVSTMSKAIPAGTLANGTTYYWRVSAKNAAGIGPYSDARPFSTAVAQPAILSPSNNGQNQPLSVTLDWSPVARAVAYRVQVSTINSFATLLQNQVVPVDSFLLGGLANNTSYYWRVSALDGMGDTSAYPASGWTFKTIVSTPAAPVLNLPTDNAKSQAVTGLALSWGAVLTATSYRVEVATDTFFTVASLVINDSTVASTSRSVSGLANGTRLYWRVCAQNAAGAGPYSQARTFTTAPASPVNPVPASGVANIPLATGLSWDPVAGTTVYRVQVSTSSTFGSLLANSLVAQSSFALAGLSYNTKYYWRVNAHNANGDTSAYSSTWPFTTVLATPALKSPADGAINQSANPILTWSPSPGSDSSVVQVSIDPLFQGSSLSTQTVRDSSLMIGPLQAGQAFYWRVGAKTVNNTNTSAFSLSRSFTTAIDIPTIPSLNAPATHVVDQPVSLTLFWNASLNGAKYSVEVAPYPDSTFVSPVNDTAYGTGTSRNISGLQHYVKYYWRVSAMNASETAKSLYSAAWDFTTVLDTPGIALPLLPAMGTQNVSATPSMTWTKSPLAFSYTLELSRNSSMVPLDLSLSGILDTATQVGPLQNNTQYFWRVKGTNPLGTGQPSSIWNFTTIIATPALLSPANDTTHVPQTLQFSWQAVNGAAWYRLQISTDSTFHFYTTDDSTVVPSLVVSGLSTSSRYFWRVVAYSTPGAITTSMTRALTTTVTVPGIPVLSQPVNNAVDQPIGTVLQWTPAVGAQTYRVQCATDSSFAPPSLVLDDSTVSGATRTVPSQASLTRYFWRVNAKNGNGTSAYSEIRQFVTAMTRPDVPQLATPANASAEISIPTVLNWAAAQRAQRYRIQLSQSATFTTIVVDDTAIIDPPYTANQLAHNSAYFWRVAAWNPGGWTAFSLPWSFVTTVDTPATPVLAGPLDRVTNVSSDELLSWSPASRAARYHVQLSMDSTFSTLFVNDSTVTATSTHVGPFDGLPGLLRYYWRVRGGNNAGWGVFSTPWSYVTIIGTPLTLSPPDTAKGVVIAPTLVWHSVPGAARYHVQLAASPEFASLIFEDSTRADTARTPGRLAGSTQYFWRVSATNLDGSSTSPYSKVARFATTVDTPLVPLLSAPAANAADVPTTARFSWKPAQYATSYQIQIATDSSYLSPVVNNMNSTDTAITYGPLSGLKKYFWRVRGVNTGVAGPYSVNRSLTTTIGTPAVIAPSDRSVNQPLTVPLSWSAVDSAYRYRVQFSQDSLFATTILDDSTLTAPTRTVSGLTYLTTYYWRVRAKSLRGSIGSYSPATAFTTVIQAPTVPSVLAPGNSPRDIASPVSFSWHPALRADTYRIQVAAGASFATPLLDDSTLTDTVRTFPDLQPLTWYSWHVKAANVGGSSVYSATRTFKSIAATPALSSPTSGVVNQAVLLTLSWNASLRAVRYRVQVSVDSLFKSVVLDDSLLTATSRRIGPLANLTQYYWRVAALDSNSVNRSAFSVPWTFTTVIAAPTTPQLAAPASASKAVSVLPTLTWKRSPLASRYRLQVATDTLFTAIVRDDSTIVDTTKTLDTLATFTKYYWHVRASNVGGTSTFSATWTFTTRLAPPVLVSPLSGAPDQPVGLQLRWTALASAKTYRVQVSPDSTLLPLVVDDSTVTSPSKSLTGMQHGMKYYWRAAAKAADGSVSAFTPVWSFVTIVDTPSAAVALSPQNGIKDVSRNVVLQWMSSARATSYQVLLSSDSLFKNVVVNDSLLQDTVLQPGLLDPLSRFWWKVRGLNRAGGGKYSSVAQFVTVITTPTLTAPVDSAKALPLDVACTWGSVPGATGYRFQLTTDTAFATLLVDDSLLVSPSQTMTGLHAAVRYLWRVAAFNTQSRGVFTAPRQFTTDLVPPEAPIPIGPVSSTSGLSITTKFLWHSGPLAARYHLQVSTDSPFLTTVCDDSTIVDTAWTAGPLQYLTKYYWRVRSLNAKGASVFTPVWSFSTVVEAPAQPQLVYPPSATTSQPITLRLRWHPSIRAVSYRLQVSTDAPFATTVFDDSTIVDTVKEVGPLGNSTTYYWRVSAKNDGWVTDYSPVWNYVTEAPPRDYALNQNYPNPFNPTTRIPYELPTETVVTLKLYNVLGQVVQVLIDGKDQKSGRYTATLDATNLAAGAYFYRLTAGPFAETKKLLVIK